MIRVNLDSDEIEEMRNIVVKHEGRKINELIPKDWICRESKYSGHHGTFDFKSRDGEMAKGLEAALQKVNLSPN